MSIDIDYWKNIITSFFQEVFLLNNQEMLNNEYA